ncbi:uncharacterized protein LOC144139524 [Haemaphysalis longicornis]
MHVSSSSISSISSSSNRDSADEFTTRLKFTMQSPYSSRGRRHSSDSAAAAPDQSLRRTPEWALGGDGASNFQRSSFAGACEDDGLRRDYGGGFGRGSGNERCKRFCWRPRGPRRGGPPFTGSDDFRFSARFPDSPRFRFHREPALLPTPPRALFRGGRHAGANLEGPCRRPCFYPPYERSDRGFGSLGSPSLPGNARCCPEWDSPCDDRETTNDACESAYHGFYGVPLGKDRQQSAEDCYAPARAKVAKKPNARETSPSRPVLDSPSDATAFATSQNALPRREEEISNFPRFVPVAKLPVQERNNPVPDGKVAPKPRPCTSEEKLKNLAPVRSENATFRFGAEAKIPRTNVVCGSGMDSSTEKQNSASAETHNSHKELRSSIKQNEGAVPLRGSVTDAKAALHSEVRRRTVTVAARPANLEEAGGRASSSESGQKKTIRLQTPECAASTVTTTAPLEDLGIRQSRAKEMPANLSSANDSYPKQAHPMCELLAKRTTVIRSPDSSTVVAEGGMCSLKTLGIARGDGSPTDNGIQQTGSVRAQKGGRLSNSGCNQEKRGVPASATLSRPAQPQMTTRGVSTTSYAPTYNMQDDRDIFAEPFFSEEYFCEVEDDEIRPDVDKVPSSSRPNPAHSKCRQRKVVETRQAGVSDASRRPSEYPLRSDVTTCPPNDTVPAGAIQEIRSRIEDWLNSCFSTAVGESVPPETAQQRVDQQETARSASDLTFPEGLLDPAPEVIVIDDDSASIPDNVPPEPRGRFDEEPYRAETASRHPTSVRPEGTPSQLAANVSAVAPPSLQEERFEFQSYSALSLLDLCGDPERRQRAHELYTWGKALDATERAADEIRRLSGEAVERRRVKFKGVTPALRKLARLHWELSPTGCPGIKQLRDLVAANRRGAEGGC